MLDLSNLLVVTDLDDTLLATDKSVSKANLEAIGRLVALGGHFTIATGRGYQMALPISRRLSLTAPAVLYNGAAIYDFKREEFLWRCTMPDIAKEYVRDVLETFPEVGMEVLIDREVYVLRLNEIERRHIEFEGIDYVESTLENCPGNWIKVLFTIDDAQIPAFADYMKTNHAQGVSYIQSSANYYEMLPQNISKGTACKRLAEMMGKDIKLAAIGDYNNDTEMVRLADFGFAVGNAVDEVREAADFIVSDCNHDAVAEMIDRLIQQVS